MESTTTTPFSAENYFDTQPPPPNLDQEVARVREFVQRQLGGGRKVVLVTVCANPHIALEHHLTE